jgi:CHAT domain-containing protein
VLSPLESALGGVRRLIAVPDGILLDFPLATLPGSGTNEFLIEELELAYRSSAFLLQQNEVRTAEGILLVGDVDFGEPDSKPTGITVAEPLRSGLHLAPLPRSGKELESVRASLSASHPTLHVTTLVRGAATEGAVKAEVKGKRYVHFATHGVYIADENRSTGRPGVKTQVPTALAAVAPSLRCGVALAGANRLVDSDDSGDGILTALEAAWLDLSSCQVLTVSGCDTALGTPFPGEGLFGLRRAFGLAGARNTVTAIWRVSDRDAEALMSRFYRALEADSSSPSSALRSAQLAMLAECRKDAGQGLAARWGAWVLEGTGSR